MVRLQLLLLLPEDKGVGQVIKVGLLYCQEYEGAQHRLRVI